MDDINSLGLSYKEYESEDTFSEDNNSLSTQSNNDSDDSSNNKKNYNDNLGNDDMNKVENYIGVEKTIKIWAGTNEIINYKKRDDLELNKTIYKYENKEMSVSNNAKFLNISNNNIENLDFLNNLINKLYQTKHIKSVIDYSNLITLDISFNKLEQIDENLFMLNNLQVLYLHSNRIKNISEIEKLQQLSKLKKLTADNNPITDVYNKFYRLFVIHYLPQIKSLDFHEISKIERNKSGIAFNTHKYKFNLQ
ncbi:leucine-rich repeat protein [Hepatocystis sp. ex Piliocolobus tephrosceles]|uniref:Leucine-rich repeat-containing protein 51 n=2 Tax=Piliocolobus tephrosceles TaxID=591936 RepID=A0A8C9H4S3_9PRIM|nr:leucine-rich repeat protein [Hepatocystis sp. ex Piliocolobus tephrosceles]